MGAPPKVAQARVNPLSTLSSQARPSKPRPRVNSKKSSDGGYLVKFSTLMTVRTAVSPTTQGRVSPYRLKPRNTASSSKLPPPSASNQRRLASALKVRAYRGPAA